jgi:hypothetical protein
MAVIDRFHTAVQEILNDIVTEERDEIRRASDLIAEAVAQDRVLLPSRRSCLRQFCIGCRRLVDSWSASYDAN